MGPYMAQLRLPNTLMFSACTAVTRAMSSRSARFACSCASWLVRCDTCRALALEGAMLGRIEVREGWRGGMLVLLLLLWVVVVRCLLWSCCC